MDKSRHGFGNLHSDGTLNIRGGYITVDLYFTDTFQYAKLYTMRDSVERILANLGEVMWDEPEATRKTGIFGCAVAWISPVT